MDMMMSNLEVERENKALELRRNEIGPENEVAERDGSLGTTIEEDMIETTGAEIHIRPLRAAIAPEGLS
jgi:two-component sensor histidine kinase